MRKQHVAVLLVAVAVGGCRSGGPVVVSRDNQTSSAWRSLVGQRLLLRSVGDQAAVAIKPGKAPKGTCDVAVEVTSADPAEGGARLNLRSLGRVRMADVAAGNCGPLVPQIALTLAGGQEAHPEEWLQTPEAYLTAHGKALEARPPLPEPKEAADPRSNAGDEARRLARRITDWPKPLLSVEPAFAGSGKVKHQGEINFDVVVGADGRLFNPRLLTSLEETQEKNVLAVLELWRFEPAREGKNPAPARYDGRTVLRIY